MMMNRSVASFVASLVALASVLVGGGGLAAPAAAQTPPVVPEPYVGVTPVPVLEPTVGGLGGGPMAANDVRTLTVTGVGSVPSGVEAVDLTLTAVRTTTGTDTAQVFVGPGGVAQTIPVATLRGAGTRQTTTVTVVPSSTGTIDVRVDKALEVAVTVRGYFPVDGGFVAAPAPIRLLGTATGIGGSTLQPSVAREIGVLGIDGIPDAGVSGIVARVTAEGATSGGRIDVAPAGASATAGESFRFTSSLLRVGSVAVGLGEEGKIQITSNAAVNASIYVDGWFDDQGGYTPVVPTIAIANQWVTSGSSRTGSVASSIPTSGVRAVALQVTATGDDPGLFSITAGAGQTTPALSISAAGSNSRNGALVWTPVRSDGSFDISLSSGIADHRVTVVVMGWVADTSASTDGTAPTISVLDPTPSTAIDASDEGGFVMTIGATDAGRGVLGVDVTVAGETFAASRALVSGVYRWVVDLPAVESGSRTYTVGAIDLGGDSGTSNATYTLTAPDPEDTILDPDTTVVDENLGDLIAYDDGTGVMTFDGDIADTITVGQVLASDPTTLAPNGYLRVVTGVGIAGGDTVVRSRQAMVTEAVRQASIDVTLDPDEEEMQGRSGLDLELELGAEQSFTAGLSYTETVTDGPTTTEISLSGSIGVTVAVRLVLDVGLSWRGVKVNHFSATAEASLTVTAAESISAAVEWSKTFPIFSLNLGAIATPIPGLVLTPEMEIKGVAEMSLGASFSAEYTVGKRFVVGVEYDGDDWSPVADHSTIGGPFQIAQDGSIDFSAGLAIEGRLNVSVNDTIGLYLFGRAGIDVTGSVGIDGAIECNATLGINVGAGAEVQIPVLGITIADVDLADIELAGASVNLFDVSCPPGEEQTEEVDGTGNPFVGEEQLVSANTDGLPTEGFANVAATTAHGRVVAFSASANDLVDGLVIPPGDGTYKVYARDMATGTTELISRSHAGGVVNNGTNLSDITPDGRYVLYGTSATNVLPGLTTATQRLYRYDRTTQQTVLVTDGATCLGSHGEPEGRYMSDDGRYIVFGSSSTTCVSGDTNGEADVFVIDMTTSAIERVSVTSGGSALSEGGSALEISADGRYVTFRSVDTAISPSITGETSTRLFRRDRTAGTTEVIAADREGGGLIALSNGVMDGSGTQIVGKDPNAAWATRDAVLVDTDAGTSEVLPGAALNDEFAISAGGRFVAWMEGPHSTGVYDRVTEEVTECGAFAAATLSDDGRYVVGPHELWSPSGATQTYRAICR